MTEPTAARSGTAAALQREFDRSFAEAPATATATPESMLAVRISGDAYAVRASDIAGLYRDRRIVALPTSMSDLLGIASFRGQLMPVYDLAALLEYPLRPAPRWLVVVRRRDTLGLAFEAFESQFLVPPEHVIVSGGTTAGSVQRRHVCGAVNGDGCLRPIVNLSSVLEHIQQRVAATLGLAGSNER